MSNTFRHQKCFFCAKATYNKNLMLSKAGHFFKSSCRTSSMLYSIREDSLRNIFVLKGKMKDILFLIMYM